MDTPRNAALLLRISDDRAGDAAGVGRQELDGRRHAERLGWEVGEVFIENDTSAFKRRTVTLPDGSTAQRVVRPEFRRLLEAMAHGEIDGLIAYHLDRVARDPRDLEDLIDVVESTGIPVESVTGSLRLSSDADITMARIGVAIANQSSRDTRRRIKRKHEELAEQGKYGGGGARRFGFEADGVTVREPEAETLRWAAARVLEGWTVSRVARELDAQGVRPVKAARWASRSLTDQLRSPRVAGMRVHRGEVVGPAAWEPILDRDTWEAVVATLAARANGKVQPRLRRWLNGVLFCGLCGHGLSGNSTVGGGRHRYWCSHYRGDGCGKITVDGAGAEAEVSRQVLEYLSRADVVASLASASSSAGQSRARSDIAEDEKQLKELSRMWAEKRITLAEYAEAREIIKERIEQARAVTMSRVPVELRKVFAAQDPAEAWERLDPHGKRDLVRLLLGTGGYVGWTVAPADLSKPRQFDPARLSLRPASSS